MLKNDQLKYCENYNTYKRWQTKEVSIGNLKMGYNNPIRLQSMASCNPMDTNANVEQAIRIIEAGGELVRFAAPAVKDAENLKNIREGLLAKGYNNPLVADIHFNPKAALVAADYVEKVRINPGNFAENSKNKINYSDAEYSQSLIDIEEKFVLLINKCKERNVAMRIGSNHGSLSQRIMDKYGDTPEGMVEAAMEYLRIANKHDFSNIVLSMKASNIRVMVYAYRLLVAKMKNEKMNFPLHLGVTEAGDGEDGRIKSAAGIGALLEDGIGDTIRVSLTEDPEFEIPVAKCIAERYLDRKSEILNQIDELSYNPYEFKRRESKSVFGIGGDNEISVIGFDVTLSKEDSAKQMAIVAVGKSINTDIANSPRLYKLSDFIELVERPDGAFLYVNYEDFLSKRIDLLTGKENVVLVFEEESKYCVHKFRTMFVELKRLKFDFPVILKRSYSEIKSEEELQIHSSIDFGSLLVDGLGDGIWIETTDKSNQKRLNDISLGILQACRSRIYKTEFISCPSCGRTLYNIQEATHRIKEKTSHLKGVKIAIMGCIVNGPGEMADADYGYVGAMAGKINLYKSKEVVQKGIPQEEALEALIQLIKSNGDWIEP